MININNISRIVDDQVILNKITCNINEGLTFIIGDSGAGKTTLLNLIGLLDTITAGTIEYVGKDYFYDSERIHADSFRADHLGWIFQDSNLINGLTVLENINLAASLSDNGLGINDTIALLKKFNLEKIKDKRVDTLSGGEKQRISIIRALVKGADIILADEPTGNLDSENSEIVFKTLKEIAIDKTVIVVTHNTEKACEYGDHIIRIKDGKIDGERQFANEKINSRKNSKLAINNEYPSKNKLQNQYIHLLSKNNFSKVTTKIRSIIIASALATASIGIIFSLEKTVSSQINEMNFTYYDADIVNIMHDYSLDSANLLVTAAEGSKITPFELAEVEKTNYFKKIVPTIMWPLYIEGSYSDLNIKYIDTDDFFSDRYGDVDLTGKFPSSTQDIVIGKDIAEDYYGNALSAIGKVISLENDYGNVFIYNIVGVNEHKNIDGIYYNYIPAQSIIGKTYKEYSSELYDNEAFESDNISYTSCLTGMCQPYSEEYKITFGIEPKKDGEIIISRSSFAELADYLYGGGIQLYNIWDFMNLEKNQIDLIKEIFSKKYLMSANDAYDVKLVGIYDDDSDIILGTQEWVKTIYTIEPTMLQCYTGNLTIAENYHEFEFPEGLAYESYYEERFSTAMEMGNMWKLILLSVITLTILLTLVIINSFTKISINQRRYELGVLKALGTSSNDLVRLLLYDSFVTGLMSGIAAVLIYLLFVSVSPFTFGFKINSSITVLIASLIIFILPIIAYCSLTYKKIKVISRTLAVELMRSKS